MNKPEPTHYGWYMGVVPINIHDPYGGCPGIEARYVPEYVLSAVETVVFACISLYKIIDPWYEPMFKLRVTGEYEKKDPTDIV